jgi:thiamine-phosphate pyrophosphorylase
VTRALPAPPVLVITDRLSAAGDLIDIVAQVLEGGCRWLMVREKDLRTEELAVLAGDIVDMARPRGARVMINGDIDAARTAGADGVHLQAAEDIPRARLALGETALIGLSCHSGSEIEAALGAGADYVTISPVFLTDSKPGYGPAFGLDGLASLCAKAAGPVIALAGISADNGPDCLKAGAAGIAVMGGVMRSRDPAGATRKILAAISD